MRLKKLTLQAFGPFKDKVVIDFEDKKIDRGVLLISGDTGSGKTTIFDAICYALYGQTSGGDRTGNSLRSHWASQDIDTYVDLEFYYKNKLYNVRRSPGYTRKSKKGNGLVKQPPKAEMNIEGRIITKLEDVKKEIQQLIGLDATQFRQVAMLSQGKFSQFLLAESEKKTEIFRKIFATELYDSFQSELKAKKSSKWDEIKTEKGKIETEKEKIEHIIDLSGLNEDEIIEALNIKIKEGDDIVSSTKEARDKKNEEIKNLSAELASLEKLNEDILTFQNATEGLESLLSSNPNIEEEIKKYDYNIEIANPITEVLGMLNKDYESYETKKEKCIQNRKCLKIKEKEYKEKEGEFKKIDNYHDNLNELNNEIQQLLNKNKEYNDYLVKGNELNVIKKEYKENSDCYDELFSLYENMRKEYYLNVSVEIAESLVDGEECPVCGSKVHPKPAAPIELDIKKEDLEKAEKKVKEYDDKRRANEAEMDQIIKVIKGYNISEEFDVELEINKNEDLLKTKEKEREDLEIESKKLSVLRQKLNSAIERLNGEIEIFAGEIEDLKKNIQWYNDELERIYKEKNTNYEDYKSKKLDEEEFSQLKKKIRTFNKAKAEFESTINHLKERVKDKEVVDLSEKEEQLKSLEEKYKSLDEEYTKLNSTLDQLKSSSKNIGKCLEDHKKIKSEYDIISVLSDTANALLNDKQKITFENYVQSYFMKTVLVEANNRLFKMTDNRYELRKKEKEIKKKGKTGLDFSIIDYHNGGERDVSSLSGGEQFMASLALALGLSDFISNNVGGIKIDSVFIDEGFGSLDPDALTKSLNILYDLSENDKLIGVISHIPELKSRIDNKILVNKTNAGSSIIIESNN